MGRLKIQRTPTIRRMPTYLHKLYRMRQEGKTYVFCTELAQYMNIELIVARKDVAMTGLAGHRRYGYRIDDLIKAIREYVGWDHGIHGVLIGARVLDSTRPFHDASGGLHADTEIWSVHYYAKDADEFKKQLRPGEPPELHPLSVPYAGQPFLVDEFGMVNARMDNLPDLAAQIRLMNGDPRCGGWCFTQLYDVEQEQNGLFRYDRSAKFETDDLRSVFSEKPQWSFF